MSDKEQIINKIYELGFEVGYKNHSEVGWVMREYNRLMEKARALGISSPENYYNEGKKKGKSSRNRGIGATDEKIPADMSCTGRAADTGIGKFTGKVEADHFLERPSLSNAPRLIDKIRAVEIPGFLHRLKLFHRE